MVNDQRLTPFWPVDASREKDLYFWLEAIEAYLPESRVRVSGHGDLYMLGGYSYLGLNGDARISGAACAAIEQYGTGTLGVRMLAGNLAVHRELEAKVASFKNTEAAAVFSSGYIANVSTIACLVGSDDTVICDKFDHASIIDGCALSGAKLVRFRHNDMSSLERSLKDGSSTGQKLVVVDAVFSMDGDVINLPDVSALCRRYDAWLMVDEAHSVGVLGKTGHGIEEHFDLPSDTVDIKMGTLSKAIPSMGGYVAGSKRMCEFLVHQARGFIYSGALPAPSAAAALAALSIIEQEPQRVERLQENTRYFAANLRSSGFSILNSETPIFPIICGDNWQAWKLARFCQKKGIYVQGIPHPVVPKGTARLRASVTAMQRQEDLDNCVAVLRQGAMEIGGILGQAVPSSRPQVSFM